MSRWLLRALTSRAEAEALLGDLYEDLARLQRVTEIRRPRAWVAWRVWQYVFVAAVELARRLKHMTTYILRDAARSVAAARSHSAFIVAVLAVSIAAATVTFSVVDAVVFRPLPYERGAALVTVEQRPAMERATLIWSPADYLALRDRLTTVDSLAAFEQYRQTFRFPDDAIPVLSARVTANLFEALRARPMLGQIFDASNEAEGRNNVAVIGYDLWVRRFNGDPGAVGRPFDVSIRQLLGGGTTRSSLVLAGVMPKGFTYPVSQSGRLTASERVEIWTPFVMSSAERAGTGGGHYLQLVGRLRDGSTLDAAQAQADVIGGSMQGPASDHVGGFGVTRLKDTLNAPVRSWMLLALAAVMIVVAIACVNVANMQLTRAAYRAREMSVRASLGATRRQLVASLLAESLMLSLGAAALALVFSYWGIAIAKGSLPAGIARGDEIALNLRVLAAAIVTAAGSGLFFGVVPAWHASREDLVSLLKQGSSTVAGARHRWRAVFAVTQVGFVCVLLVSATLVIVSFVRVTTADLGFVRSDLLVVSGGGVPPAMLEETMARLRQVPGIASVGAVANGSPPLIAAGFGGGASGTGVQTADRSTPPRPLSVEYRHVSSSYFATAGIPVVMGQVFDDRDAARRVDAVVIDEPTAKALFGDRNPIGAEIRAGSAGVRRVSAVVRGVFASGPERPAVPQIYLPPVPDRGGSDLLVRITRPAAQVTPAIRGALPAGEGGRPAEIRLVDDAFRNITADRRFNATLMSLFAVLALFIGAAGVYGVMASIVAQRTREIGVRVALGASTPRVVRGVLAHASRYVLAGLVVGLPAAFAASRLFGRLLFQVQPSDVSTYVIVSGLLLVVGVAAAVIPAWRAARVDPLVALRTE